MQKKRTRQPRRIERIETLLVKFVGDFATFKRSTHRSFRQLTENVGRGFANLDAKASAVYYDIREMKDELGTIHETVNSTYNKMDAFVGTAEQNKTEIKAMDATLERIEGEDPEPPPDVP